MQPSCLLVQCSLHIQMRLTSNQTGATSVATYGGVKGLTLLQSGPKRVRAHYLTMTWCSSKAGGSEFQGASWQPLSNLQAGE